MCIIVFPFYIGESHKDLIDLGFKVVEIIESNRKLNNTLPKNKQEIENLILSENDKLLFEKKFTYKLLDHNDYNKNLYDKSNLRYNDSFELQIHPWFMWDEYYRYENKFNRFIIDD